MDSIFGFADPVSSWLHLAGAVAFAMLGASLLKRAKGSPQKQAYFGVYAVCCVFVLFASGLYHLLPRGAGRSVMLRLDHAAIFALMAGTLTAIQGALFRGWRRWIPLVGIWSVAVAGITLKALFFRSLPEWCWVALYVVPSWVISVAVLWLIAHHYGPAFLSLPVWGGVAFTAGVFVNASTGPVIIPGVFGPHEMWHVLVLVAMGLHWKFIYDVAAIDDEQVAATLKPRPATS